ncbi:GTPase ObgE [soil metagenome]
MRGTRPLRSIRYPRQDPNPPPVKFVDYVTISVRSGSGGAGSVHFHRAKYTPKGGPDGGDGGNGGSVILEADPQLYTLLDLRYNRHHFAKSGDPGGANNRSGKTAPDIVLRVPPGTVVRDHQTGEHIGEVLASGDRLVLAQGGAGGRGNSHFKSPTNQAPRYAQPGTPGEEREVALELKLLADVGLVGFPNAGKSTLVSVLSAAKPKIADYPFTTLEPSLGMVYLGDLRSFVMADIPGIIEGASEGRGLGLRFLKHVERNAVMLICLPADAEDPLAQFRTLQDELNAFSEELATKKYQIALTKLDLLPEEERDAYVSQLKDALPDVTVLGVSSVAQIGLEELKESLWSVIDREEAK